jgi:exopolysaccharide biosynthesis polyprenyl glycosylphosphotransferase
MKQRRAIIGLYVLSDYLASVITWYFVFLFRKCYIEGNHFNLAIPFRDNNFFIGILIVPELWLLFHYLTGTYTDLYKKSRLQELGKTLIVTFFGGIIIFFLLLLNDYVRSYVDYYFTFCVLLLLQFSLTTFGRQLILFAVKKNVRKGRVSFQTLLIGNSQRANDLYEEMKRKEPWFGFWFVGYIGLNGVEKNTLTAELNELGKLDSLDKILDRNNEIEEIIIAIESSEHHLLNEIINRVADRNVTIRIIPDMYDILSRTVKMNHAIGEAFIEIPPLMLSEWERITKRWFDILASTLALIFTSPVCIYVAIRIRLTDGGPVFYTQERLGQYGRPFYIIKFRSMKPNAEGNGPQLTAENDSRITPVGRTMRKYRIDELPQFFNVILGDMSVVGPRAERKYFAERIMQVAPHYRQVFKVQPGITSLGMVKYGYASNVEQMIKRLKYDIIYIENMSIMMDFKIMIYTVLTILYGRGK